MSTPQILVTNDDGIDSDGIVALALAMREHGNVTIVAPDGEYSGTGAAIGSIYEHRPEVHRRSVEGISDAFAVSGPPALCVFYARLNAFGFRPDLIVSGINPGANVGRSVYHSGTIGACLTGRNANIPGVAVSQAVPNSGIEGQAWGDVVAQIDWSTSARIASAVVKAVLSDPRPGAGVLNVNVPAVSDKEIVGWEWSAVGSEPPRAMNAVILSPKPGYHDTFTAEYEMGEPTSTIPGTDVAAIAQNYVSLSWLSPITAEQPHSDAVDRHLGDFLDKSV